MTSDDKLKLIEFHSQGLSDRKIAKILDVHHRTIAYNLKKLGLETNNPRKLKVEMVDEFNAKCSKCCEIKHLSEFKMQRVDKKYEYRLTYCNTCRKQQQNENLRSSPEKFLKDRYNRLKRKCLKNRTILTITFEELYDQYVSQKGRCFYTDEIMNVTVPSGLRKDCLSIDKVIPQLGYIKGNVVLCIWRINSIKSDATLEEMKEWMPNWYERIMKWKPS